MPRPRPSLLEWERWGKADPMYGVATVRGREFDGPQPWTVDDFYRMGEDEVRTFLDMWQQYLGKAPSGDLAEIGCGAGRLTRSLAARFEQVFATDISTGMLEAAREHMPSNVVLRKGDGLTLPFESRSVDAGFSYIVFQHFDGRAMIEQYVKELARVLRPGGTVMLHVPAVEPVQRFRQIVGLFGLRRRITQFLTSRGSFPSPRQRFFVTMNYRMYNVSKIQAILKRNGFTRLRTIQMPGSDRRGTFHFGRFEVPVGSMS
ncbi:MAG: class I SAM-dependent methyltransferase [Candidatus Sumerlaeaceae bacterium]